MPRLAGKVAIVTGGASGIGEAIVRRFVEEGARVVIGDIREDKGSELAKELGKSAAYLRADVTNEENVELLFETTLNKFNSIDCVVNNAGAAGVHGPIEDTPTDGFDATYELILRSVFLGVKHAARRIKPNSEGTII